MTDVHAKKFGNSFSEIDLIRWWQVKCVRGQSHDNPDIFILIFGKSSHPFSITNVL